MVPSNYFKIIDKNHDKLELKKLSYKNGKQSKRKTRWERSEGGGVGHGMREWN